MRAFPWFRRPITRSGLLAGGRTGTGRRLPVFRLLGAGASCLFALGSTCPTDLQTTFFVEVHATGTGAGTVTAASDRISCDVNAGSTQGDCSEHYVNEPGRHLYTATPADGSTFAGWVSLGNDYNPCTDPAAAACELLWTLASSPDTVILEAHFVAAGAQERELIVSAVGDATTLGVVYSGDGNIRCPVEPGASDRCTAWYALDAAVTLEAQHLRPRVSESTLEGHRFEFWEKCTPDSGDERRCTVVMDATKHVVAHFHDFEDFYGQVIYGSGAGTGTVTSHPTGIVCTSVAGATSGTCVALIGAPIDCPGASVPCIRLTPTPAPGSVFGGWYSESYGYTPYPGCVGILDCHVTENARVVARFDLDAAVALTVALTGTGTGSMASSPAGIDCSNIASAPSTDCSASYPPNTVVTLVATPGGNATFAGWSGGGCSGTSTCVVTLAAATTVTATFDLVASYDVTVSITGTGEGTVTSSPTGIDCANFSGGGSTACTASFPSGTVVTLSATPNGSAVLTGWSGGGCSGTGTCVVTVTATTAVTATFEPPSYALTVAGAGTGAGTVTEGASGIACSIAAGVTSGTCTANLQAGLVGAPVATPVSGSVFTGWSGSGCSGTGACLIPMTAPTTVTATFDLVASHDVTVSITGTGEGTVTSSPTGIDCANFSGGGSTACTASFPSGTVVTLSATPNGSAVLTGWSGGGCSGTGTCVVTVTATTAVTATFDLPSYGLTVAGAGTGAGTVTEGASGIACSIAAGVTSGICTGNIQTGVVGQPVAVPAQGSIFGGWTGDCTGTGACYLTMDQARSVTATFTTVPTFTLTIRQGLTVTGNGAVSSSPTGVACIFTSGQTEPTGTCVVAFPIGTVVTLVAGVAPPSTFTSWSGVAGCSSSPVCQVTMDQDQTVDVVINP